jgi:anti-sigma regulatory factor (Ser/Thr protein kinase)
MTMPVTRRAGALLEQRWRRVFPGENSQIRELRKWLVGLLPGCAACDDLITVAVELATNAIRHTASGRGGWFAVEVSWHHRAVRVAVADQGAPTGPRLPDEPDPMSETGHGLLLVAGLSSRTAVSGDERARLVWAEVPWEGGNAVGPDAFPDSYEAAIRDGEQLLSRRHRGVPAWFGRSTLQWWAVAGWPERSRLVTADSPQELVWLLDTLHSPATPPKPSGAQGSGQWAAPSRRAALRSSRSARQVACSTRT